MQTTEEQLAAQQQVQRGLYDELRAWAMQLEQWRRELELS